VRYPGINQFSICSKRETKINNILTHRICLGCPHSMDVFSERYESADDTSVWLDLMLGIIFKQTTENNRKIPMNLTNIFSIKFF
jgi:hypothetical protein